MMAKSARLARLELAARGGVADHRREGAGGAADHDVLRRRALQPHRVDDDIEEDREGEQRRREPVGDEAERQHREDGEHEAEAQGLAAASCAPAGIGRLRVRAISASMSASYHMLSAPEAPAPTAMASSAAKPMTGLTGTRRDQHAGQRREDDERHHARLQQREIIAGRRARDRDALAGVAIADEAHVAVSSFGRRGSAARCVASGGPSPGFRRSGGRPPRGFDQCSEPAICGSVSNVWNGGGEGSVHSSVVAPTPHGLSPASRFFAKAS